MIFKTLKQYILFKKIFGIVLSEEMLHLKKKVNFKIEIYRINDFTRSKAKTERKGKHLIISRKTKSLQENKKFLMSLKAKYSQIKNRIQGTEVKTLRPK